jgi:hypothetical protein
LAKQRVKNLESFIEVAREVHGDKYDYSLAVYTRARDKVKIRCIKHDHIFEMPPNAHISAKQGCSLCAREIAGQATKLPLSNFIERAEKAHGGKYEYDLIPEGTLCSEKVSIVCKEHGVFIQGLFDHASGKVGCKGCRSAKNRERNPLRKAAFVEKARLVHGDKYDYTDTVYIGYHKYIKFLCPIHGEVSQRPDHHLTTSGCPKCGMQLKADAFKFTTEEFITKAKEVHGDVYDYSKMNYVNSQSKIEIICPKHGSFIQAANSHLYASGCPRCSKQRIGYRSTMKGTFYILKVTEDIYKFGITNNFERRFKGIQQKCVYPLEVVFKFTKEDGYLIRLLECEIIASSIKRGVLTKQEMGSGFTETFSVADLPFVMSIVEKHNKPD